MNPQRPKSATARSQIKVWLPTELYNALKIEAKASGISMTALIVEGIRNGVTFWDQQKPV